MATTPPHPGQNIHASCVSFDGFGVLITGPSGSGKSSLALQLLALGADLVADDRTIVTPDENRLLATAPASIQGQIEARNVGLLPCDFVKSTKISLVVDMSLIEKSRLPAARGYKLLGQTIPMLHKVETNYFPAAILLIAKSGAVIQID